MIQTHVNQKKKDEVVRIAGIINNYSVVGIADLQNLPAGALASIKKKLRGKAEIIVTKKPLIQRALEQSGKPNLKQVTEQNIVMPALVLGKTNPFAIYSMIKKSKTKAAAKPGQLAPFDITVPAGPTPFTPGPVISELSALKIKAGVEEGKIVIKQDVMVIKAGDAFSPQLASMLARLGIEPIQIGLNVAAMYEHGKVYAKDILDIDDEFISQAISRAAKASINLAVNANIIMPDTIVLFIQSAHRAAQSLSVITS
ncbi:50S ribosomal protein L10 [Candidatus Woesearchaeota archaeon]|nr:50S ribosomal protein L10 [Candidatus Woesearchaeota archaeon]